MIKIAVHIKTSPLDVKDYVFDTVPRIGDMVVLEGGDLFTVLSFTHVPHGIENEEPCVHMYVVPE